MTSPPTPDLGQPVRPSTRAMPRSGALRQRLRVWINDFSPRVVDDGTRSRLQGPRLYFFAPAAGLAAAAAFPPSPSSRSRMARSSPSGTAPVILSPLMNRVGVESTPSPSPSLIEARTVDSSCFLKHA